MAGDWTDDFMDRLNREGDAADAMAAMGGFLLSAMRGALKSGATMPEAVAVGAAIWAGMVAARPADVEPKADAGADD